MVVAFQKMLELCALDWVGAEFCKASRRACQERRGLGHLLPSGNWRSLNRSHMSIQEKTRQTCGGSPSGALGTQEAVRQQTFWEPLT